MKTNKMDTVERCCLWASILGVSVALAGCSIVAPGAYILVMATIAALGVLGGSIAVAALMFDCGPIGWLWAGDIVKAGVEIAIGILQAAASASSGD